MITLLLISALLGEDVLSRHSADSQMMLDGNNLIRQSYPHLPTLQLDATLCAAAQDHANFMARYPTIQRGSLITNPVYSHDTNGGSQYRTAKYGWHRSYSEILAMRPAGWRKTCWGLWGGSPSHWSAVLSRHTHVGYGVAVGPDGCTYYVALYGTP